MSKLTLKSDLSKCVKDFHPKYGGMCAVKAVPCDGGAWLAASNGKVAAVVEVPGDLDAPCLMPGPVCKPGDVSGGLGNWEHRKGKKITVFREDVDGLSFPPVAEIMKGITGITVLRLDARELANLARAVTEGGGEREGHVTLLIDSPDKAIGVLGDVGFGVIATIGMEGYDAAASFAARRESFAAAWQAAG